MKRLTVEDYFKAYAGHPGIKAAHTVAATILVRHVNLVLDKAIAAGVTMPINPKTGTLISGDKNGGWRPLDCPIGAPSSSHKTGEGVDIADGDGDFDDWLFDNPQILVEHDLYAEHPSATRGWAHLTTRPPKSGRRFFFP